MLKGVIFDLDGTLIDSEPIWRETDFLLAKKYNFPLTDKFREQLTGRGIKECAELFVAEYQLDMNPETFMNKRQDQMYQILFRKLELMPQSTELIEKLKSKGFMLALATAGHQETVAKKILSQLSIERYFSVIVSGLEVKHSKPAPDIFLETAKRMSLKPAECIVIEDAYNGVLAAKAAGMKVIGVNKEQKMKAKFKEAQADFIFENLKIPLEIFSN